MNEKIIDKIKYLKNSNIQLIHSNEKIFLTPMQTENEILEEMNKIKCFLIDIKSKSKPHNVILVSQIKICSYETLDKLIEISETIEIIDDLGMYDQICKIIDEI
jgi:hypothetical protein